MFVCLFQSSSFVGVLLRKKLRRGQSGLQSIVECQYRYFSELGPKGKTAQVNSGQDSYIPLKIWQFWAKFYPRHGSTVYYNYMNLTGIELEDNGESGLIDWYRRGALFRMQ